MGRSRQSEDTSYNRPEWLGGYQGPAKRRLRAFVRRDLVSRGIPYTNADLEQVEAMLMEQVKARHTSG